MMKQIKNWKNHTGYEEFREAIRINPEDVEAHNKLADLLLYNLKRYNEAEKEFMEAKRIDSKELLGENL